MSETTKPAPRINSINRRFFESCNSEILALQKCLSESCGRYIYFPRVCCPYCGGGELEWRVASGRGTIETFGIVHRPNHPSFFPEAPYCFAAVRLDEGPIMFSRVVEGCGDLIGRRVVVTFVDQSPNQKLPYFRLLRNDELTANSSKPEAVAR